MRGTLFKWLGSPLSCCTGSWDEDLLQDQLGDPVIKAKSPEDWKSCLSDINTMYKEMNDTFTEPKVIHRWYTTLQQFHKWKMIPVDCF